MIMENKVAIVTQSYKNDFKECKLLCESMDKFAPDIDHYIFVNDEDLEMFMRAYMDRMTPDFVNLSIGLRAPQLYEETAPLIMKVPQAFLSAFTEYLIKMHEMEKIPVGRIITANSWSTMTIAVNSPKTTIVCVLLFVFI